MSAIRKVWAPVAGSGAAVAIVLTGPNGAPNRHHWLYSADPAQEAVNILGDGTLTAYITVCAFSADAGLSTFKGRTAANARLAPAFFLDIEGSEEKGGYDGGEAVIKAVRAATAATGLTPNLILLTGSGGAHLYWVLDEALPIAVWLPMFRALAAKFRAAGLKFDPSCVADPARIMRAPGSFHAKAGKPVRSIAWRDAPYTVKELADLIGYTPEAVAPAEPTVRVLAGQLLPSAAMLSQYKAMNDAVAPMPQYSAAKLAAPGGCGAFAKAMENDGRDTKYPVWFAFLGTSKHSQEGEDFAHQGSRGHPDYDQGKTDQKLASINGGPANCETWAEAYGPDGPCDTCPHKGRIKNPIALGIVREEAPAGSGDSEAQEVRQPTEPELAAMNERFAQVRIGGKVMIVDFRSLYVTANGTGLRLGFMEQAAFRSMLAGKYLPPVGMTGKPRPMADAWLSHPLRRQYWGVAYAPGETLPPSVLNLWQGFAVEAAPGDVSPWLRLLEALVPNVEERAYVVAWFAKKVQDPGVVPDTILIFTGAKGTGKNSIVEPLVLMFGMHAMLADDPELIAGRFTWHLMDKSFAVLDEAVFVGDPRQMDRIKSRVTAKVMMYEQKGADPVQGINRCAYVMLTNHAHAWAATADERRAVVLEVGDGLRGNLQFWTEYHAWLAAGGAGALLHYLQQVDVSNFNPRAIPRGEALRRQTELTALRDPVAVWWHQCLTEGCIEWRDGGITRMVQLSEDTETVIDRQVLRLSFEQSASARTGRADWPSAARKLGLWCGPDGLRKVRARVGDARPWREELAPLPKLRESFTACTHIVIEA